jgi:chromosome partitioning protein
MVIAITNQKGGVGKSTSAFEIGAAFRFMKKRVLLIDLDGQQNLTYTMQGKRPSTMALLKGEIPAEDAIEHTENGDIISSDRNISGADLFFTGNRKQFMLSDAISPIKKNYDVIILDTPPSLGIVTINALTAADKVIFPAQTDAYSLQAIGEIYQTIQTVKQHTNKDLSIMGILISRYNGRTIINRELAEAIEETARKIGTAAFKTRIRECNAIKESLYTKTDIFTYAPNSNAAIDYANVSKEILSRM